MLDVHRLRVLRTVVATGSVGAAATTLGYTPSAVSQHLATLQRETGLRLIERKGRGIEPTAAGRTLADEAGRVLESLSGVEGVVGDLRAGSGRTAVDQLLRLGRRRLDPPGRGRADAGVPRPAPRPAADRAARRRAPRPRPRDLRRRRRTSTCATGGASRACTTCSTTPTSWSCRATTRWPRHESVALGELAGERWVDNDFNRGFCRQVILDACAEAGFSPDFRIETHDYPTAISFVAAGVGVTVLPGLGAAAAARGRGRGPPRGAHAGAPRLCRGEGLGGAPPRRAQGRRTAA